MFRSLYVIWANHPIRSHGKSQCRINRNIAIIKKYDQYRLWSENRTKFYCVHAHVHWLRHPPVLNDWVINFPNIFYMKPPSVAKTYGNCKQIVYTSCDMNTWFTLRAESNRSYTDMPTGKDKVRKAVRYICILNRWKAKVNYKHTIKLNKYKRKKCFDFFRI